MSKAKPKQEANTTEVPPVAPPEETAPTVEKPNPFSAKSIRLKSAIGSTGAKKLLTTVPVRRPGKQEFIRVNPDPEYCVDPAAIIELKDENEMYLVKPELADELEPKQYSIAALFTVLNRQKVLSLWPVKLGGGGGARWHQSALTAAREAMQYWVCLEANRGLGAYEVSRAIGEFGEPEWPLVSMDEILEVAFRSYYIDTIDHLVLRRLRGEV